MEECLNSLGFKGKRKSNALPFNLLKEDIQTYRKRQLVYCVYCIDNSFALR